MLMFLHPPRPLKRHTISKCCAIFSRNPFPSHQFHISCRPHRPTQHLVLQLPGQENCIFGRCHQLAQASKHHPRTWCGPAEGEKTTGLFPKEAAIMDTVFMFILEIKFSPKFTCSQTKWMPPRRFSSCKKSVETPHLLEMRRCFKNNVLLKDGRPRPLLPSAIVGAVTSN